jgi:hypothetical protein
MPAKASIPTKGVIMDIVIERGAGLDVHKHSVVACVMGTGIKKEIRTYSTVTNDLLPLKAWLKEHFITHVAMESTGVYLGVVPHPAESPLGRRPLFW